MAIADELQRLTVDASDPSALTELERLAASLGRWADLVTAMERAGLRAVTVSVDPDETQELLDEWHAEDLGVPLRVIDSPYREVTSPVLNFVKEVRSDNPRDVVCVYIPEYVVGHWWEQILHNQSALRLKTRLLFEPNVMVTSVPWQLHSSERLKNLTPVNAPGDLRRGIVD